MNRNDLTLSVINEPFQSIYENQFKKLYVELLPQIFLSKP